MGVAQALANLALLLACTAFLYAYWRREAARHPLPALPATPPPDPDALLAELGSRQREALHRLQEAEGLLRRVGNAFRAGIRDGRRA